MDAVWDKLLSWVCEENGWERSGQPKNATHYHYHFIKHFHHL